LDAEMLFLFVRWKTENRERFIWREKINKSINIFTAELGGGNLI
jgi:hypothetical protein